MPLTYSEFGDISNETPQQQVSSMFQQQESNPLQQPQEQPVKYKPVQDFKYNAVDLIQNSIDWQYLNDEQKQKALEMAQTRQGAMELITTSQDWQQLNDEQRQKLLSGLYTPEDVKARDELITKEGYQTITPETYQTYKETGYLISPEQQQQADKEAQATYERLYEQSKGGEITPAGFSPEDVQTAKWEHLQKQYPVLSTALYNIGEDFGKLATTYYKLTGNEEGLKDVTDTLEKAQEVYESADKTTNRTWGQKALGSLLGMVGSPVNAALLGMNLLTGGAGSLALAGRLGSLAEKVASAAVKLGDVGKLIVAPSLEGAAFGFMENYGTAKTKQELGVSMATSALFFTTLGTMADMLYEGGKIAYDKFKDITSKLNVAKKGDKKVAQEVFSELNNELEKLPEKEAQEISNKAVNNSMVELETKANEFAKQYGQEVNIDEVNPKELGTATDIKEQVIKQRQENELPIVDNEKAMQMYNEGKISLDELNNIIQSNNKPEMPLRVSETPFIEQTGEDIGKYTPKEDDGVKKRIWELSRKEFENLSDEERIKYLKLDKKPDNLDLTKRDLGELDISGLGKVKLYQDNEGKYAYYLTQNGDIYLADNPNYISAVKSVLDHSTDREINNISNDFIKESALNGYLNFEDRGSWAKDEFDNNIKAYKELVELSKKTSTNKSSKIKDIIKQIDLSVNKGELSNEYASAMKKVVNALKDEPDFGLEIKNVTDLGEGASGTYNPIKNIIKIAAKENDPTTFMHEIGHYLHNFLPIEDRIKYLEYLRKNYMKEVDDKNLGKMLKLDKTKMKPKNISQIDHYVSNPKEFFAEQFAQYLEGKGIIDNEIKGIFNKARRIFRKIWYAIRGEKFIDPELRNIFDRLLKPDKEIGAKPIPTIDEVFKEENLPRSWEYITPNGDIGKKRIVDAKGNYFTLDELDNKGNIIKTVKIRDKKIDEIIKSDIESVKNIKQSPEKLKNFEIKNKNNIDFFIRNNENHLSEGDVFQTISGRETTPLPKTNTKKESLNAQRLDKWLVDNAIKEAEARNDDYNLILFKGMKDDIKSGNAPDGIKGTLTIADRDSINQYLFGEDSGKIQKYRIRNIKNNKGFITPTLAKSMAARGGGAVIGGTIGYKSSDKDDNLWEKFGKTVTGAAVGAAIGGLGLYRDMLKTTKSEEIIKKIPLLDKPSKFVLDGHGLGTLSDEAKDFVLNEAYYGAYRPILGKKGELADRLLKKLKDLGVTNYSTHEQAIRYLTNPEYRAEIASKLDKLPDDIRDKAKELFGTLDKFRRIIDANSAELLMRGKLSLPAYVKNLEKYTRRQYLGEKSGLDNIPTIKYGKKYMDLIGETTPEEREAMGYIADVEGELAATSVLQNKLIAWDEYTRKLFKGALDKELDILAPNAKDYIVELPESLRLMKLPYKMSAAYAKNELLGKYGNLRTMYQWLNLYEKGELKGEIQNELIKQYIDELKTRGITLDQVKKDFREFIKDVNKKYAAMSKLEPAKSAFAKWDVLPKDKRYGVLAGLPMDKSLVNQLATFQIIDKAPVTTAKMIQKQAGKFLSIFRWAKTVGGMPYSLSKNFLGNWAQWVAGGGSVQTFPAYFVRGLYEINRKGKLYDMLKRKGLLHENYAEYEVRKQLQQAFGKYTLKELEESGKLSPKRALAFVRNLMDEMTDWYGAVDDAAKIGRFLYERQHGKDTIKAIRTAQDVHFDYSLVPKTVGTMRDVNLEKDALLKLGGNPFITYNYKYLSLLNNMVKKYPIETGALIGLSGVYLAPLVVKAYTKLRGIKESSIKKADALMPSYFDKENVAGFYDPETKMYYYLDLSKTIPGSDLFQKPENHSALEYIAAIGKGLADSIGIFRHPALAVYNATKGKDPFGIPIWHKSDTLGERMIKGAEYIGKTWFMPATIERELRAKTNFHPELARLLGFNVYTYTQKQLENKLKNEINQVAMDASVEEKKVLKELMVQVYKLKQKNLTTDEFNKKLNLYKQDAIKQIEKLEKEKFKKKKDKLRLDKWKAYFDQLKKEKQGE